MDWIINADQQLLLFFNGYHTPALDSLMMFLTGKWTWVPLYVVLAALLVWLKGWKRALVLLIGIGLTITLADQICATLIRPYVARLRPAAPDNPLSQYVQTVGGHCPRSFSFPSCHAANSFALATFLSLVFRKRWASLLLFFWAALVSYTRLYLGVHHPGDILAGAAIGSLIAWGVWALCRRIRFGQNRTAAVVALLLAATSQPSSAQKFEWGGEFATIFDNREGDGRHTGPGTYFLTRLAPEIGISFRKGTHRVMGGAVWTQPIGCEWHGKRISPTLYYRYESRHMKGSLGMFPRTQLQRPLPEYLVSDSARYFQHNLRGALLQGSWRNGYFDVVVDWRGMRTEKQREAFAIVASGEWQRRRKVFIAGGTVMLNHLAKVKNPPADQYVVDNIIANPYVGIDFLPAICCCRHRWHALSLRAGAMASLTRDRADHIWRKAVGLRAELDATFWRISLRNVAWVGNSPLFPLYARFGTQLNDGEAYYASKWYNRTELSGLIVRYKNIVDLRAELDFHLADRNDFMFYQRLILTVKI